MDKKGSPNNQKHAITKHVIFPLLFLFALTAACTTDESTVQAVIQVGLDILSEICTSNIGQACCKMITLLDRLM